MWIWTLDDRLINADLVESIELLEVYPENADSAQLEVGALEPEAYELVAVMASGQETLLYDTEDGEAAYQAYEALAALVARGTFLDGTTPTKPISVFELVGSTRGPQN